ncbi:hypothetical protein [Actinacidiphila glaucinigra]|uniref:hypothetical protein n=1 Tax=Actinacidiphila glaucinigra TaxID=235986 RepID=UPI00371BE809
MGLDAGVGLFRELLGVPSPFVADSRARWFSGVVSAVSDRRFVTPPSTALRSRGVLICASGAATWTAATAATVVSRSRTRRTSSRPRPSSRSVRIGSSRATEAASYSR